MRRAWAKFFVAALVALILTLVIDFAQFLKSCRYYAELAEAGGPNLPESDPIEAIVVLAGDRFRIPRAIELLHKRNRARLVISGTAKNMTLTNLINQQTGAATNIHEVWDKIVLEGESSSTLENAIETGRILSQHSIKRIILITSEYHMTRALQIFKNKFPELDTIAFPITSQVASLTVWDPVASLKKIYKLLMEYLKFIAWRTVLSHSS